MIETLLIDLDDTLIPSGHTYHLPRLNCCKLIAIDLQPNCPKPEQLLRMQSDLSKRMMAEPGPIGPHLESQSWMLIYQGLCEKLDRQPNNAILSAVADEASKWFIREYKPYDGVVDTLKSIKQQKIIVTLGTHEIQEFKIHSAGLTNVVDAYEIVDLKITPTYEAILEKYELNPKTTAMIGDNPRLDIEPALDLKMRAFHIVGIFDEPMVRGLHPYYKAIDSFNRITEYL